MMKIFMHWKFHLSNIKDGLGQSAQTRTPRKLDQSTTYIGQVSKNSNNSNTALFSALGPRPEKTPIQDKECENVVYSKF